MPGFYTELVTISTLNSHCYNSTTEGRTGSTGIKVASYQQGDRSDPHILYLVLVLATLLVVTFNSFSFLFSVTVVQLAGLVLRCP